MRSYSCGGTSGRLISRPLGNRESASRPEPGGTDPLAPRHPIVHSIHKRWRCSQFTRIMPRPGRYLAVRISALQLADWSNNAAEYQDDLTRPADRSLRCRVTCGVLPAHRRARRTTRTAARNGPSNPNIARRTDPAGRIAVPGKAQRSSIGRFVPRSEPDPVQARASLWQACAVVIVSARKSEQRSER